MTRHSIEFFLQPPSPPLQPPEPMCVLPPVSSLLPDEPSLPPPRSSSCSPNLTPSSPIQSPSQNQDHFTTLPRLRLPHMYPNLTLTIPCEPCTSLSTCSSPSTSPLPSFLLDTPQSSPSSSPHPQQNQNQQQQRQPYFLLPPPDNIRRCRSLSNASSVSSVSSISSSLSAPSTHRRLSDPPLYSDIMNHPSTSSNRPQSASPSIPPREPKRKRGRPSNVSRQAQRDSWTFVTPTVWDVKRKDITEQEDKVQSTSAASTPQEDSQIVLLWPTDNEDDERCERNSTLNTFTSTKMDATLTMPKKKRGRKPKMQLAGNSCFVWRDLTARRGANRKKKGLGKPNEDDVASRVQSLKLVDDL
ncbi:hypothetical protein EC973_005850 [Apophysomyces ossiformis]|uniref:Uncharacterized protein n=1 Tax=Apophysomyces ossiformis TaxID=679940 RepID=A0A8H7ERE1_9FUNG|nr:hypothetical protein EC973_005850 [Apophysomyces ossiformis]